MSVSIEAVFNRLPAIQNPEDKESVIKTIDRLKRRGFSFEDTISYLKCIEEVNPHISETVALDIMGQINAKYPEHK